MSVTHNVKLIFITPTVK